MPGWGRSAWNTGRPDRCVAGLHRAPDGSELLVTLAPPAVADPVPFLIDAALHSIAGLVEPRADVVAAPLPSTLARARRSGCLRDMRHAWVRRRPLEAAFDVVLTDDAGRVILTLDGFAARHGATAPARLPAALACFQPHWEAAPLPPADVERPDLVLLAGPGLEDLAVAMAAAAAGGVPCRIVAVAAEDPARLLADLPEHAHVVLLGGRRTETQELARALRVLGALAGARRAVRVTVVSCAATDAGPEAPPNWRGAALLGLAKVAMREAPHLAVAALDIGPASPAAPKPPPRSSRSRPSGPGRRRWRRISRGTRACDGPA